MAVDAVERVRGLMPRLRSELADLVAIPSISAPGFPEETQRPLVEAYESISSLLREAGVQQLGALELPGTAPVITGGLPAPDGAPTVLLYGHYDVVPPATSPCGSRRRSRPSSATGRSTAAALPTPRRTSSSTSVRCAPGTGSLPWGSSS